MTDTDGRIADDSSACANSSSDATDQTAPLSTAQNPEPASSGAPRRSGDDSRHRGWFWHWNSIVTQYAPLIGLKGIGLLNSYTTWTDRREHSPYHGYAFPSQKSEAAFYGEDRAELIAINKILVVLDLIEIRKEMILRTDDRGRRWKVPHNFYRVKDRPDGSDLTYADVARVIELAAVDKSVFRYLRRLFSTKFKPIDANNPWHAILDQLESNTTWQELRRQVASREARASARARAGHRSRSKKKKPPTPDAVDAPANTMTVGHSTRKMLDSTELNCATPGSNATSVESANHGSATVVEQDNTGLSVDAEQLNSGFERNGASFDEETDTGSDTIVEQSNTMYYKETTTTTTTANDFKIEPRDEDALDSHAAKRDQADAIVSAELEDEGIDLATNPEPADLSLDTSLQPVSPDAHRSGIGENERLLPDIIQTRTMDDPGALVVSLFESANDRTATGLERVLLSELVRDADPAARTAGSTGAGWVAAALREAVASGSSFVAPKRIREIVIRWAAEDVSPELPGRIESSADPKPQASKIGSASTEKDLIQSDNGYLGRVWIRTLANVRRSMEGGTYDRLFTGSSIATLRGNNVSVQVSSQAASEKLSSEYSALIVRCLSRELHRDIVVTFNVDLPLDEEPSEESDLQPEYVVTREEERSGRQLWKAVLALLDGSIPVRDLDHLRNIVPLGQNAEGSLVLGLPGQHAGRLVEFRYRSNVESACQKLFGTAITLSLCGPEGWTVAAGSSNS